MRRRNLSLWAVLIVALMLAAAFVIGCGDESANTSASGSPAPEVELSAQDIVDQSEQAMQAVNSASFTADVRLKVEGDPAKMSDPSAKQLLASPITFHAEGSSSSEPMAADMDMTIGIMGQNLAMGVLADGNKAWIKYEDTWYAVPQENTKALESNDTGALPTQQLKDLGLDPQAWDVEWELVGTETVDGVEVYHVAAAPNVAKLADDLMKALNDPKLYEKFGDSETAQQLEAAKAQNEQQLDELKKALDSVAVDLWIETETMYLRKGTIVVALDTTTMEDAEGVEAMDLGLAFTMADFGEPVKVTPPAKAKDFDELMNDLVGGMMGGSNLEL